MLIISACGAFASAVRVFGSPPTRLPPPHPLRVTFATYSPRYFVAASLRCHVVASADLAGRRHCPLQVTRRSLEKKWSKQKEAKDLVAQEERLNAKETAAKRLAQKLAKDEIKRLAIWGRERETIERLEYAQTKIDQIAERAQLAPKGPKVKRNAAIRIQARLRACQCRKQIAEKKVSCAKAMRIFFLLGGPGSGKSTYAKRLAAEFGLLHVSVGQLLRDACDGVPAIRHAKRDTIRALHSCSLAACNLATCTACYLLLAACCLLLADCCFMGASLA